MTNKTSFGPRQVPVPNEEAVKVLEETLAQSRIQKSGKAIKEESKSSLAGRASITPATPKSKFYASDSGDESDTSAPTSPHKAPPAPAKSKFFAAVDSEDESEDASRNDSFTLDEEELDDPFRAALPTPPASPQKKSGKSEKTTPVSKFIQHLEQTTPDHTLTPSSKNLQKEALERIENMPLKDREEALKRLAKPSRDGLERSQLVKVIHSQEGVIGVENLKQGQGCWPLDLAGKANRMYSKSEDGNPTRRRLFTVLDATHVSQLETSESGLSVKGKHMHDQYLPGSCIHPQTRVWCVSQRVITENKNCEKGSKFSTYFPLKYDSNESVTALIGEAWTNGTQIASKPGLYLYKLQDSPLIVEIPEHNFTIIPTAFPILDYAEYDDKKVFTYDMFLAGKIKKDAVKIAVKDVLPAIRARIQPNSEEIRYVCKNGDLIIDIAYFLKEAGYYLCPIEKGILIKFPREMIFS